MHINTSNQGEKKAEFHERWRVNREGLRQALRQRPNLMERQEKHAQMHSKQAAAEAMVSAPVSLMLFAYPMLSQVGIPLVNWRAPSRPAPISATFVNTNSTRG